MEENTFCKYCGKEFADDVKFCSKCGKQLFHTSIDLQGETKEESISVNDQLNCGEQLIDGAKFCLVYGVKLDDDAVFGNTI